MGLLDMIKLGSAGQKAYRTHVQAMDLRKKGKYAECEQKLDEAMALYREAYAKGDRKFEFLRGYAVLSMRRGDFEKAREIMLEMNKDKSMTPENKQQLRIDFALCQWKMGKLDKAVETMERAASGAKSGTIYNTMGVLLIEQARVTGDFERALQWNLEAYDYDDEDAETLDNLGQLYLSMAEKSAMNGEEDTAKEQQTLALDYFRRAWEEKPDQITSSYYYARLLNEDGDRAKAKEVLEGIKDIPITAMIQVEKEKVEALTKQVLG